MQSGPSFMLRKSLRSFLGLPRTSAPRNCTSSSPLPSVNPILSAPKGPRFPTPSTSVCLRCQLRAQTRFYSTHDGNGPWKDSERGIDANAEKKGSIGGERDQPLNPEEPPATSTDPVNQLGKDLGKQVQDADKNTVGRDQEGLPSEAENRRSKFAKKFGDVMDNMQSNVFIAGRHLNDLTGYSSIEKLKRDILAQEDRVRETRASVRQAKETYSSAINRRSTSQREVNELLQRKHAWTPTDLERFTSLYRSDHANERAETEAQEALAVAERDAEEAAAQLSKTILARYHEEQIWSDKIRRMSTWGTWGLMGVNVLLFLVFQIAVEPWRRQRLVRGFEEKVVEALEKENGKAHEHKEHPATSSGQRSEGIVETAAEPTPRAPVAEVDALTSSTAAELTAGEEAAHESSIPESQPTSVPTQLLPPDTASAESWRLVVHDLFSDRSVSLSQRDLTTIALESAAAGAAVMGVLIAVFRPR